MENLQELIQWCNLETRGKNSKMGDYDFIVYRSIKPQNKNLGNYLSFSDFFTEIYKTNKKINVGLLGGVIVLNFNNEQGININLNKSSTTVRMRVSNKSLVDMIFDNLGFDKNKASNTYFLKDLGNNTFSINRKSN